MTADPRRTTWNDSNPTNNGDCLKHGRHTGLICLICAAPPGTDPETTLLIVYTPRRPQ